MAGYVVTLYRQIVTHFRRNQAWCRVTLLRYTRLSHRVFIHKCMNSMTVHLLLLEILHGTLYQLYFVAYPHTARFAVALKHFCLQLTFVLDNCIFLGLFYSEVPLNVRWGCHGKRLIDWSMCFSFLSHTFAPVFFHIVCNRCTKNVWRCRW